MDPIAVGAPCHGRFPMGEWLRIPVQSRSFPSKGVPPVTAFIDMESQCPLGSFKAILATDAELKIGQLMPGVSPTMPDTEGAWHATTVIGLSEHNGKWFVNDGGNVAGIRQVRIVEAATGDEVRHAKLKST